MPLFAAVPGFIFFNDEPVLFAIGHSVGHVRTRISRIIDSRHEDILSDNVILHLNERESLAHFLMACGRWIVFILPVFVPTAFALYLYITQHRFFSRPELNLLETIVLPLLIIDGMMLASLLFSIGMAVGNQVKWRRNLFIGGIGN
jgi:hypothetical protein